MRFLKLAAATAACLFALAAPGLAAYDPLSSGTVSLRLDQGFKSLLTSSGIAFKAVAPATRRGNRLVLPVSGGKVDPLTGKGTIVTDGAFVLSSARGRVTFRVVTVKAKPTPLYAKVGGGQLKVATSREIATKRVGFGTRWSSGRLKLTPKVVTRLNKKLRPRLPFEPGQALGSLTTAAQPETVTIQPALRISLALAPEVLEKFQSLFVSLNPISPAELAPGPVFTFPILTESALSPDASRGELKIGGDIELLQLGGGQVFWHEDWLDFTTHTVGSEVSVQPSPPYAGKMGRVAIFAMGTGSVTTDPQARTIDVSGLPVYLQEGTARILNEAFAQGKAVFASGEQLGTVSFKAAGQ